MVRETRHLWVGNLPDNIREERIREHFKRYGKVQSVKIRRDADGVCATVSFIDLRSAAKAHVAENKLDERLLKTEYYEPPAATLFSHDDGAGASASSSASAASRVAPSALVAPGGAVGAGGGASALVGPGCPPSAAVAPPGAPYAPQGPARNPRFGDERGYYYDRTGDRDPYVRRTTGYHDEDGYQSRGRSRDRYARSAASNASAYQDGTDRCQASSILPGQYGSGSHFRTHGVSARQPAPLQQSSHFDASGGYGLSPAAEPYSDDKDSGSPSAARSGLVSRRGSAVSSTVTSPPQQPQLQSQSQTQQRCHNKHVSRSESRSRSSSRSSSGSRLGSSSSKIRSSSSDSSRSLSPSKSPPHHSSSTKASRSERPASAVTAAPSSSSFLQSTISTPNSSSTNANNGSSSNCLQNNNNNSLDGSSMGDREDKRPLGICVRNLPVRSTDTSLKDGLFHEYKKHGKVTVVKVIGQGTERYAVVCFKKPEDVEKALEVSKDKLFFGCKIEVTSHEGLDGEDNEFRPLEAELDEYHPKATRTLFIGNLEKDITTTELRKHFDQFGDIIEIDIKKQGSASSYAFIQYADIASVVKAMRKLDGENLGANRIKLGFGKSMPTMCVWLDGVTEMVSDKFLSRTFGRYGPVSFAVVDRERGHALVYFDSLECAQHAVAEMRGRVLGGKKLQVDFASRECQSAFFDKIEMSGQVLQNDRIWEGRRERRQEFDVIRDERFTRDGRGVAFDGRGYSRYEAQQRTAGRGPSRGLQRGGTYNSRGRGQPFGLRYDGTVYQEELCDRRHRFSDKDDSLEDITPYEERAERLKHIDGVLGTADWAPRKTSSSIKKHRNSTSDQESHHSQSPPQSRHHSRSPPPSVKGSKKGSSKERPSQRHRLSPGRSSSRSPVVRDVALDLEDVLVDVRDIRRRSLDGPPKSDSKELPLASVCSKLEAFQDSGGERIRSSSCSSSRTRREEDVNSTSDSPSQLERKRRLLGLKESSGGSRPEDSRSDTDCAEGDEELSIRSDSKYLSKQVQDILSSSDGECSPNADGAARKKGKGLPTDTSAATSRSRPTKDIPSVVSKRLPTNCRTVGSFETKFSVEVPSVRVGELLQNARKQIDPRRRFDHNRVSSTVSYLRAKKMHSDPSLVSSTDSEVGSQDASLTVHLSNKHGEDGIDEVSSSSDNPPPLVRTWSFLESGPMSLPLPKFAATLRSPKASPCVGASPMANSQSPRGNCSPLSALNTKNGPVFPEALARPEKPVEEKPVEVIPPETVPEALSPSPSPKGLKGPSDSKLHESSSDSEGSLPSPNRPSFDERIRALDERYNALTGPTRTYTGPSLAGAAVETPAPVTIDYNKYNIKKRPRFPALSQEFRAEPSEIMKTLLAKTTILDQDSKRLEHINEKYEPKDVKLDLCSSSAKPLFRTKAAAKEFSTPLSLPSLGFSSCTPATSTALPQGASSPSFAHASTAAPGASPSQTVPNCPSQCTTSQTLAAPAPLTAPEPHSKHVPLMVATSYNDTPTRTVPPSILRRESSPPCVVKQEPLQSPPLITTPLSPPAAVVVKKEVSPRASSLLRRDSSPPVVVKQEPFQSPPRTPAPPVPLAVVKKEPGSETVSTKKDSRNREPCAVKLEPAAVKEPIVKKEVHKDSSIKKESRKEHQSSSSKNSLRDHPTSDASCNSASHKERRDSHSHDSLDLPAPLPLASVKQRVSSVDSNESDSAKSSRSSDAYLEVPPEATWNRSEDERRCMEPDAKRPKLSHSSRDRDSFDKSHSSNKSSSSHSKKSEKRLEKSSSSSSSSFKSERTEKLHSSSSSKNESGDKQDTKLSSESRRDSSKSKDDKKSLKSRDGREKSRDRPKEKESSKEKGQDSKHGSSSGSHAGTSSSSSKQRREHGSDRSEKEKSRSEKRTSSTSEQARDSKSKSKSKSESNSASAPQASDFCFLDDEPVYFSMYDKVKARSSQNQTLKDQANMETMRQKFSRLKQSRAKKGKSADMDSDRDSDLSSHHSSDSESKSRPPHKSKQLTKKRKLVIESSSDENEQSFAMRLLHKDDDSSDFCSDSEVESYKEAFNKCKERKVDISDVETSDSDEPSHLMAASRKQKRKQRHSSEKSNKSRHGKSDIESSDADISRSLKRKELKKKVMRKPNILKSDAEGSEDECHTKTDEGKSLKQRSSRQEESKSDVSHSKETVGHSSSSSKSKRPSKDTDESKHEEDLDLSRQRHSSKKRKKSKKSSKLKEKKSTEKSSMSSLAAPSSQKRSDAHWDVGEMLDESSVSSKYISSPKQTLNSPPVLQPSIFSDVEMKSELSDYDFEPSSKPVEKVKDRHPEAPWESKHNVVREFSPVKDIKQEREEGSCVKRESDSELDKIVDALSEAVEPRGVAVQEFSTSDKKEGYDVMDRVPYDDVTCDVPSTRHLSEDDDNKESSLRQEDLKSKEHRKKKKQSKEKKRKHKEEVISQSSAVPEPVDEPAPTFPVAVDEDSKLTEDIRLDEDIAEEARRLEEELLAQSEETSTFGDGDSVPRREEKPLQAERHFEEEAAKETKRLEEELFSSGRDSWHMKDEKVYDDVATQKEPKTDAMDVSSVKDSSYSSLVATEELPSRHSASPHYLSHDVPEQFKMDDKEQNTYEVDSPRKMEDDLAVYALLQEMGNDGISAPELPKEPDYLDTMVQHHQPQHEESMSFLLPDESSSSLQIDTSMPDLTQEESRDSGGALEFTDALQSLQQQEQSQPQQQPQQHQQEQQQNEHEELLEKIAESPVEETSTCGTAEEEPARETTSEPPLLMDAKEPEPSIVPPKELPDLTKAVLQPEAQNTSTEESDMAGATAAKPEKQKFKRKRRRSSRADSTNQRLLSDTDEEHQCVSDKGYEQRGESISAEPYQSAKEEPRAPCAENNTILPLAEEFMEEKPADTTDAPAGSWDDEPSTAQHKTLEVTKQEELFDAATELVRDVAAEQKDKAEDMETMDENNEDTADLRQCSAHQTDVPIENDSSKDQEMFDDMSHRAPILDIIETLSSPVGAGEAHDGDQDEVTHQEGDSSGEQLDNTLSAEETPAHTTEPTVAGTEGIKRKTGSRKGRKTKSRRASVPRLEVAEVPKVPARRGRATSADKVRRCLRSDNIDNTLSETEDASAFPSSEVKNEAANLEAEPPHGGSEAQLHDEERLRLSFDGSTSKESTDSSAAPAASLTGGHSTDNTLPEEKLGDFCMDPYKEEPKKRRGRKKKSSGEHHSGRISPVLDKTSDLRSEDHDFKDADKQKERPLLICTRQGSAAQEHKLTKGSTASAYDVYEFKDSEDEEETQFGGTDWQVAPEKHLERHIESAPKTAEHAIHEEGKMHELRPAECPAFESKLPESNAHDARLHETKTHELRSHDASRMHDVKSHDGKVHDSKANETVKTYDTKAHDAKASDAKTNEVKVYEVKAHEVKAHESQHEKRHDESKHKTFQHEDKEACTKEYVTELSQHGKISITIRLHQKDGHDGSSSSTAEVVKTSEAVAGDDTRQEKVPPAKQEPTDAHQIKTRKSARLMSQANKTTIDETIEDVVKGHFKALEEEGDLHSEGPMTRAARRTRSSRRNEEVPSKSEPEGATEATKAKNETPVLIIADNKVKDNVEESKPVVPVSAIVPPPLPPPPSPLPPPVAPAAAAVETLSTITDSEPTSKPESKMSLRSFRFTRSAAKAEMSKDMGVKEEPSHETEPFKDDLSLQQQPRPEAIRADAQQATVTASPAKHEQTAVKDEQKVKASAGPCETEDSDSRLSPTELIDPVTGFLTPVNKSGESSMVAAAAATVTATAAATPVAASEAEVPSRIVKPQGQQVAASIIDTKTTAVSSSVDASISSWSIPSQAIVDDSKSQQKEGKPPLELIQRPPVLAHSGTPKSHGILQAPVIHGRPTQQALVTTMSPSEHQKVPAAHVRPEAAISKPSEMPVGPAVAAIKIPEQHPPSNMPISTSVPTGAMPGHLIGAKGLSLPQVGQPPVSLGQPPGVSMGQPSVSLGQPSASVGQPAVSLCQPAVSLGQPSISLGQPPLGVWVGPRPPIGTQYPSSFTSLTGQQHLVRGVHPSVVRTPSLPQQEAANKMPGAAHAMVGGPNPSQVHCSQPKMEGPASQLSAQQPHHHPQQHIQSHPSHASQQHSQPHAPSPHQQLMQQQQQQHQVPQQQALQHQLSQHHHQQLQPPSQQQHQQQHQQQQPQQGPGLHPSHHPGEIKGVPVSVTQHIQSPQQPHVVTSAHIKAEGFAMPSQAMGRVGSASRTPPAPVPRQMTLVEGVVASRSQGPPQPQGPAIMTQAPTKIHEQRAPVGSKGSLLGNQHAAKQTGGFLQPPFGGYEPSGMPGSSHAATGGSTGVAPPGGGVIAELLQNPHLMQQHKNYQLAVAASQYMGGGPLGRPGASLHVGGPNPTATPPQELLHLRPTPGQQLLVAGHLGMHTPELSAYMHHQQMLYAAAQQHPHYALPPEAQGLRFAYPTGGFRAPPEPREGITKEGRPPPPLKGSDAEPTVAEGAPKEVPSKELLRPPFPPLRQTSPRVASSPQERVTDSPAVASPYGLRGAGHLGPADKGPSSDEPPKPPVAHQGFHEPTGGLGGSPPFLHSPGGALALKKEADVAKKGVSFDRRQTGLEAPLHLGPPPAHALAPPPAAPRSQPQTPPHASQVPPQGDSFLLQRYPVMWQGLLALKNDQAAVQMHFVSGNSRIAVASLPPMTDGCTPPVRIAQRMRLEQTQLEGVARKMQMLDEHCILLALPCGRDHMDVLQQSNNLRNGFINYLQLKQAAGIVNAAAPGSQQPAYVIHIFPSCEFSNENLARIAPDLLHSVSDIAHLLVIIATV